MEKVVNDAKHEIEIRNENVKIFEQQHQYHHVGVIIRRRQLYL